MKKTLLFLIFVILGNIFSQDLPSGHTTHYSIRMWSENANPSADSLNQNWIDLDNALYNLIVTTDTTQLQIRNDTLILANQLSGKGEFSGTKQYDTVTISALDTFDVFLATPRGTPTSNDILGIKLEPGKAIIQRNAGGTSGLKYYWSFFRKYN